MKFPVPPSRHNIVDLRGMPDYASRVNPAVDPWTKQAAIQLLQARWGEQNKLPPEVVARMRALSRVYAKIAN